MQNCLTYAEKALVECLEKSKCKLLSTIIVPELIELIQEEFDLPKQILRIFQIPQMETFVPIENIPDK